MQRKRDILQDGDVAIGKGDIFKRDKHTFLRMRDAGKMKEAKLLAAVREAEEALKGASPKKCAKLVRRIFVLKARLLRSR